MNQHKLATRLNELIKEIGSIPAPQRRKLVSLAQKTELNHENLKKSINDLQDSLDYLRLSIKYLVFDLEATRRENKYLKHMINKDKE